MTSESYENYVHVLQQSFRPSEKLAESLRAFMKPEAQSRPLSLLSTQRIYLDSVDVALSRHTKAINDANGEFKRRLPEVSLDSQVGQRQMGERALRLAFLPSDYEQFTHASQALEELPGLAVERHVPPRRYIYIDIARAALASEQEQRWQLQDLREKMANSQRLPLYSLYPDMLVGHEAVNSYQRPLVS